MINFYRCAVLAAETSIPNADRCVKKINARSSARLPSLLNSDGLESGNVVAVITRLGRCRRQPKHLWDSEMHVIEVETRP